VREILIYPETGSQRVDDRERRLADHHGSGHKKVPVEGVQFHPESVLTSEGKKLMGNFLKIAS